ncbi:MAG: glycosyltransferase family 2 protein [Patescibacteria group bacterium]|nr:glycosyltransferase family 2 protein [Patescibacteria group bacterium]
MAYPKVGIIVLNWNGLQDTKECLESLRLVTYPNFRIYLVDNASTNDESKKLKDTYGDFIELIQNNQNLGFAGGNNSGIKKALAENCDYIVLLNNDTIVHPEFLKYLVESSMSDPKIGIIGSKILKKNQRDNIWFAGGVIRWYSGLRVFHRGVHQRDVGQFTALSDVDFITGCCLMIRKEVIEKIGLMSEEYFLYFEDIDWSVAAKRAGWRVVFEPRSVIWHKEVSESAELSPQKTYYLVRNYLYFSKKYASWLQKIFFIAFFEIYYGQLYLRNLLAKKGQHNHMLLKGIRDYRAGLKGQLSN